MVIHWPRRDSKQYRITRRKLQILTRAAQNPAHLGQAAPRKRRSRCRETTSIWPVWLPAGHLWL